jgi:hypothetical protein
MHHLRLAELQDCFIRFLLHLSCIWNNIKWTIHQTWLPSQLFIMGWSCCCSHCTLHRWLIGEIHQSLAVKITSKNPLKATVKSRQQSSEATQFFENWGQLCRASTSSTDSDEHLKQSHRNLSMTVCRWFFACIVKGMSRVLLDKVGFSHNCHAVVLYKMRNLVFWNGPRM